MSPSPLSSFKARACQALLSLAMGACTTQPAAPPALPPMPRSAPSMALEKHHVDSGGRVSVDYQIERKISSVNGVSCYAFITGTLNNDSSLVLSRRTVIDFNFFSGGKQNFRDLTYPLRDVAPGSRSQFEMVVSPVHKEGCVNYDRIEVAVRKVAVN